MDIRLIQILLMLSLLAAGAYLRDFSLSSTQVVLTFAAGLLTQLCFLHALQLKRVGFLSAVITCIGVSLLLRSDNLWAHPLCCAAAIGSKFVIRYHGKHIFNPGNFGVIAGVLLLPGTWVSSGQWGSDLAFSFWLLALGSIGVTKVRSTSLTWPFIIAYTALWVAHRIFYLGYEWAVLLHQLKSGSFLLFAFFMISDPKTTPNHGAAKVLYACTVAGMAYFIQYYLFYRNSLLWALFLLSPLVPLFDRFFDSKPFEWKLTGGSRHEKIAYRTEAMEGSAFAADPRYVH